MASYNIALKPSVEKDLRSFPASLVSRLMKRIEGLRDDPFPRRAVKLSGTERLYRIRVGDYRIIYDVG
jgi:mRNA interferase RelE/StbE